MRIAIVDLGPYLAGEKGALERAALEIAAACGSLGFFFVKNHGVPASLVERVFRETARFHALSPERKMQVRMLTRVLAGYLPLGGQTQRHSVYGRSTYPDSSTSFYVREEFGPDHPDRVAKKPWVYDNRWPDGLPGFLETLLEYFAALDALGRKLLPAQAVSLGLPPDYFTKHEAFSPPSSTLRLLMYPPRDPALDGQWGIGPHTDYGHLTILAQSRQPGLEVLSPEADWIEAPALDDHFLINTGDLLRRWTNDRIRSAPHRVVNRSGEIRYSIPYFFGTRPDVRLECLPSCHGPGDPPRHAPQSFGEFLAEINRSNIDLSPEKSS
jgi:isopenicillin N synthase-like dioxygenase